MTHRCPCPVVKCSDKTCLQYNKHYTCMEHQLHIGDIICQKDTGWRGWIYDSNPWGSKRSVLVNWEQNQFDEGKMRSGKLFAGHAACIQLQQINEPRKGSEFVSHK